MCVLCEVSLCLHVILTCKTVQDVWPCSTVTWLGCGLVLQQGIILVDNHKASPIEWIEELGFCHLTLVHKQAVTAQGENSFVASMKEP